MDAVVAEARITLDARLLSQDIVVLAFEVANNLLETEEGSIMDFRASAERG